MMKYKKIIIIKINIVNHLTNLYVLVRQQTKILVRVSVLIVLIVMFLHIIRELGSAFYIEIVK